MSKDPSSAEDLVLRAEDAGSIAAGNKKTKKSKASGLAATSASVGDYGPTVVTYTGAYPPSPPEQPFVFTANDC
jgi:hypothetical protein